MPKLHGKAASPKLTIKHAKLKLALLPAKLSSQAASASSCKAAGGSCQAPLGSCFFKFHSLKLCKPSAKISFKLKGWFPKLEAKEASEPSKRPEGSSEAGCCTGSSSVQAAASKLGGDEALASKAFTLESVFCKFSCASSACCSQKAATDEAAKAEADGGEAA